MSLLSSLAEALDDMLAPIEIAFENEVTFTRFLNRLGWSTTVDPTTMPAIRTGFALADLFTTVRNVAEELDAGEGDELTIAEQLLEALIPIIKQLQALASANPAGLPFPLNQSAFWDQAPLELVDYLVIRYLELYQPLIFAFVYLAGVAEIKRVTPTGSGRIAYDQYSIQLDRLGQLITDPAAFARSVYHWNDGANAFDFERTLLALNRVFAALGRPVRYVPPRKELADRYYPGVPLPPTVHELAIPFISGAPSDGGGYIELGLLVLPLPPDGSPGQAPNGLLLTPLLDGYLTEAVPISRDFSLELAGGFDATGSIGVLLRPGSAKLDFSAAGVTIDAHVSLIGAPKTPWILIGDPDSTRLVLGGVEVGIRAKGPVTDPEIIIQAGTGTGPAPEQGGAGVVIDFGKGDGFLQKMLGGEAQTLSFAGTVTWSTKHGLGFSGQAALEANLPVHISIAGVLTIDTIYISLRAGTVSNQIEMDVAVAGGLDIGPVAATVDRVGLRLLLTPKGAMDPPGNLGRFDLGFGFKPPNGLGLLIDAGPVVGGGYIFFDPDKGQYAGVLELSLEFVQIKAIGLLDTVLPDGSKGFSFLLIITTEFTPIQLGFGFTLNGVGGLAGINRTMVLDALRAGLKNHDLNSILFPPDPIKNARQIISDLSRIFPPSESRYVFGPMLEIGYGSPSLVIAEIGIVLEIPSPVRLAILGQIRAVIPTDEAAVIIIHLDVLGTVDFGLEKLAIDATIYDSRIAAFALLGDMALRLNWGGDPQFAFSLGGLNAQFQPPPAFPQLHRLTVSIGDGDNPRLSLETYVAITSNTFQFGADLELVIVEGPVSVHGFMRFDALFIFSPFHFAVEMQAGVAISVSGMSLLSISLDLLLQGPTPWIFDGTASISFLFFSISVHVHGTFGSGTPETLPAAPVMPPLIADLNKSSSWSATLPGGVERSVSFRGLKPDDTSIVVHPVGHLTLREKVVPLSTPITKFGSTSPSDGDEFEIGVVKVGTITEQTTEVSDEFAIAQFKDLSDADKLSAPSYQPFPGGVSIGSGEVKNGQQSDLDLHYDTQIIDDALLPARTGTVYKLRNDLLIALGGQSAAELAAARHTGNRKFVTDDMASPISNQSMGYVIVHTEDLTARYDVLGGSATTHYMASHQLQAHIKNHPEDAGRLLVVPVHEAAA